MSEVINPKVKRNLLKQLWRNEWAVRNNCNFSVTGSQRGEKKTDFNFVFFYRFHIVTLNKSEEMPLSVFSVSSFSFLCILYYYRKASIPYTTISPISIQECQICICIIEETNCKVLTDAIFTAVFTHKKLNERKV